MSTAKELKQRKKAKRTRYVVGFMFDPTLSKVVLIRKAKPEWQRGLLNGVGGKIGDTVAGETPEEAIHREFREEAGVGNLDWLPYLTLQTPHSELYFFRAIGNVHRAQTQTEEDIGVYDVHDVMDMCDTIPNLRWCIQMARTFHFGERAQIFNVEEVMIPEWIGNGYEIRDGKWVGKSA